jgi:hypothetical protein
MTEMHYDGRYASSRNLVTPSDTGGSIRLRLDLDSPMSPHAISSLRRTGHTVNTPIMVETINEEDEEEEDDDELEDDMEDDDEDEVELDVELDENEEKEEKLESIDYNVLIPESDLNLFVTDNFVCKKCHAEIHEKDIVTYRIGCACNLFWDCSNPDCMSTGKILARTCTKDLSGKFQKKYPKLRNGLGDYDINRQIVLACQQSGGGARTASTFSGLMSLSSRSIWATTFTEVEELIGIAQIRLGKKIIAKNLEDEIAVSPMNHTINRRGVALNMDGGWDQRASGKSYNSPSGRVVSVGGRTKKVCGLKYFSKRCAKCERKKEHPINLCANPEKYNKSSKAMESNGSVDQVLEIWETCPNAYCSMIITDEDATTRSKLSHCMAELVANNRMTEAERRNKPLKEGNLGTKKGDHGVLPLDHPEIEKLSDPIHFIKNYKSELYKLVRMGLETSQTCKPDATRLSRNLAYMLAQHTPGRGDNKDEDCTFEKFLTAGEASFEHHWNNHDHCGSWCSARTWTVEENEEKKGKFRNKATHAKEYEQQRGVKEKFLSEPRMRRCFHQFCNNKTEQIHGLDVNVFLPKNLSSV